jgi:ABC-type phosphate/phosphonate transport system substrate-binding protein
MKWVAALPMYNVTPALADDWRALLAHVHARMRPWLDPRGDSLAIVEPLGATLSDFWLRDDILLSQTCGYPLVHSLANRVQLVATPAFRVDGCENGDYHSVLVASRAIDARSLEDCRGLRAAYNSDDSNSGMNLLRQSVAPLAGERPFFSLVLETGSHLASLRALAVDQTADVAAIDCVTFEFVREHLPELADGVRVIGVTQAAPGLPLIASKNVAPQGIAALATALSDTVMEDSPLARRLKLKGFVRRPLDDYARIRLIENDAIALGYPQLA